MARSKSETQAEVAAQGRKDNPKWDESEFGPWSEAKVQVSPNVVGLLSTIRRWQDVVSSITCPTLLITADPNLGAIVTPEIAQTILEVNEDIELIHLPGAGHNIRREQFEPFVEVVTEFLKRKR